MDARDKRGRLALLGIVSVPEQVALAGRGHAGPNPPAVMPALVAGIHVLRRKPN